jgi:hypothetical protein
MLASVLILRKAFPSYLGRMPGKAPSSAGGEA